MAQRISVAELNGVAKPKRQRKPAADPAAEAPVQQPSSGMGRRAITLGMGCGIPCLSLALSSIGGRLLVQGHTELGASALVLCCSVLAVSLLHLAWAVGAITRSAWWQSWCLAVAIDPSLVLGELAGVAGFDSVLVPVVMGRVCVVSAVLNGQAFLRH
jgi:hypothetical protein